jgi:pSer/pThr/pTyr-binding forkhead associated (FHA) protein
MLFRPLELITGLGGREAAQNTVHNVVFPLATWGEGGTVQVREYTIGSDAENDIVIPGFSVSARHAVIRYRNGRYTLFDVGSTNGTAVNGVRIEPPGRELTDGDKVHFSRYEFSFLAPESLYRKFKQGF